MMKQLLDLHWWVYLFMVLTFFSICLLLNYILKKVNEAKIEERFIRMRHKQSRTQSTQVQGALIEMEANRGLKTVSNLEGLRPSPQGISLVFNREENMTNDKRRKDLEETFNIIKNTIDTRKHDVFSLTLNTPQSTNETSSNSLSQYELVNKNESEHSSHTVTNKTSFLDIPLQESKVISSFDKIDEDVDPSSFLQKAVDSIISKIVPSTSSKNDEPEQERTLSEWIKEWLVPQVPKDDVNKPSYSKSFE